MRPLCSADFFLLANIVTHLKHALDTSDDHPVFSQQAASVALNLLESHSEPLLPEMLREAGYDLEELELEQ